MQRSRAVLQERFQRQLRVSGRLKVLAFIDNEEGRLGPHRAGDERGHLLERRFEMERGPRGEAGVRAPVGTERLAEPGQQPTRRIVRTVEGYPRYWEPMLLAVQLGLDGFARTRCRRHDQHAALGEQIIEQVVQARSAQHFTRHSRLPEPVREQT